MPRQPVLNKTTTCECGNAKTVRQHACKRCTHLDGAREHEQAVIAALRENGNSTLNEVCAALGMDVSDNNGRRSMLRTMQGLMRTKRVRRYEREQDTEDRDTSKLTGNAARISRNTPPAVWVYALDGRTTNGR